MKSYSQAGQDRFAYKMSGEKKDGTFLDVGAHDGRTNSNTLGLEEAGWTGTMIDIQYFPTPFRRCGKVIADTRSMDWPSILGIAFGKLDPITYLSLDVDESTTDTLERILAASGPRFSVITIEHDKYRLGVAPQMRQHGLLDALGYDLVCSDVIVEPGPAVPQGGPFEDWWVSKCYVPKSLRDKYRCHAQIGRLIVPDEDIAC